MYQKYQRIYLCSYICRLLPDANRDDFIYPTTSKCTAYTCLPRLLHFFTLPSLFLSGYSPLNLFNVPAYAYSYL